MAFYSKNALFYHRDSHVFEVSLSRPGKGLLSRLNKYWIISSSGQLSLLSVNRQFYLLHRGCQMLKRPYFSWSKLYILVHNFISKVSTFCAVTKGQYAPISDLQNAQGCLLMIKTNIRVLTTVQLGLINKSFKILRLTPKAVGNHRFFRVIVHCLLERPLPAE